MVKRVESITDSDESGYLLDESKIYSVWRHRKTNHEYFITGFGLNSKTGLWEYQYKRIDSSSVNKTATFNMCYHREPKEWHEILPDGKPRFVRIAYSNGPEIEDTP